VFILRYSLFGGELKKRVPEGKKCDTKKDYDEKEKPHDIISWKIIYCLFLWLERMTSQSV
jgi:hypothetical protein